jgi:hypothetical protein
LKQIKLEEINRLIKVIEDSDFTKFDKAAKDQMLGNYLKETYLKGFFSQRAKEDQNKAAPKRDLMESIMEQKKIAEFKMQTAGKDLQSKHG